VVRGRGSVASGRWSVVGGQWSVASGRWQVVSSQWSGTGERGVSVAGKGSHSMNKIKPTAPTPDPFLLLVSQRDHWVESGGAMSWRETSYERNCYQQNCDARKYQWIGRANIE